MKYFINIAGKVFAFEDDAPRHYFEGMTPISKQEAMESVQPTTQYILEEEKAELRTLRAPMLDALSGIAGRAARSGNDGLATEADALAEQLLGITDDAALNAATTHEAIQAAGMAAYRRIASGASAELASVFKEITGV